MRYRTGVAVFALLGLLSAAHAACPSDNPNCTVSDATNAQDDEDETPTLGEESACQYMSYMLPSEACMNSLHNELACRACPKSK